MLGKEKAKSLEPKEKGIHPGLLQFRHSVSILAANVYVGERSHPGIKGEMAGGIVGVAPPFYAVLNPFRPMALADSAEESLGCRQSVLILVHVRSAFGGTKMLFIDLGQEWVNNKCVTIM